MAVLTNAPMPLQESFRNNLLSLPLSEQKHIDAVLQRIVEMMKAETIDAVPMLAQWSGNRNSRRDSRVSYCGAIGAGETKRERRKVGGLIKLCKATARLLINIEK
jgi:hypothetical protein